MGPGGRHSRSARPGTRRTEPHGAVPGRRPSPGRTHPRPPPLTGRCRPAPAAARRPQGPRRPPPAPGPHAGSLPMAAAQPGPGQPGPARPGPAPAAGRRHRLLRRGGGRSLGRRWPARGSAAGVATRGTCQVTQTPPPASVRPAFTLHCLGSVNSTGLPKLWRRLKVAKAGK